MKLLLIATTVLVASVAIYLRLSSSADPDRQVVKSLRNAGADLTKPHAVDFFLYLPDEAKAKVAADRATRDGDSVSVAPSAADGDSRWVCQLTRRMVPELNAIRSVNRELTAIATDLGGIYDGWGAEVVH
jgi:hypothetical protein